jgi:hypothetical protein
MSTDLSLTRQEFFANNGQITRLNPLIVACMQRKAVLEVEMTEQAVYLRVEDSPSSDAPLSFSAQAIVPGLDLGDIHKVGTKLIFPFLYHIQVLRLPHRQITYLGREFRSIAEFFARNLFLSSARNVSYHVQIVLMHELPEAVQKFQHEYYFIFKHLLPEDRLRYRNAKEAINLIVLNACLGVDYFSHGLINRHLVSASRANQSNTAGEHLPALKMRLLETRTALLAQS